MSKEMATLDVRCQGDGVMKLLLWGAATGRIAAVLGGVPRSQPRELLLRLLFIVEVAKVGRAAMCESFGYSRRWSGSERLGVLGSGRG